MGLKIGYTWINMDKYPPNGHLAGIFFEFHGIGDTMGYHGIASDRPEVEQVRYGSEAPMGFAVSRCEEVRGDPGRLWMTLDF